MDWTPGVSVSASMSPSSVTSARWRSIRFGADSRRSMPSRMSCSVFADSPRRERSSPASAALRRSSIVSMPSSAWIWRTLRGPSPGIRNSSTRLGGISAHRRS